MRKKRKIKLLRQKKRFDSWIAVVAVFISLFGILIIFEASNVIAFKNFGDKYYFVKEQIVWFLIGFIGMILTSFISYKKYYKFAVFLLILSIIFLVGIFIPGLGIQALGAKRRLNFGIFSFQPSEFIKLSLILFLSSWLIKKEKRRLIPFLVILSLVIGLVVLQPDLGTAVIIFIVAIGIYFVSNAPLWHFLIIAPLSLISVFTLSIVSPYRFQRIVTFFNPNFDPLGASYHIRQILITLGSGGLLGVGLGSSKQKYQYLPEATTDSIFAIIGEDFGFIGSLVFILIYTFFLLRIYRITISAPDKFSFLLGSGILALFLSQLAVNLGSQVALLPLTGSSLPFVSYGGSNLIVSFISVGIILNISRHRVSKG